MKKIASVVGARPNFIKLAPIHKLMNDSKYNNSFEHIIIHTVSIMILNYQRFFLESSAYQHLTIT